MNKFYTLLGAVMWKRIINAAECIGHMNDERFYRAIQSMNPDEKRLAMQIRNMKKGG